MDEHDNIELIQRQRIEEILSMPQYWDYVSQYSAASDRFSILPDSAKLTIFYQLMHCDGELPVRELHDILYERDVVDIDTFLDSPQYLGAVGKTIYPRWREELRSFLAPNSSLNEWVHTGSIGTGKSTVSRIVAIYKLYEMLSFRHPQATYGLTPESTISVVIASLNQKTAKKLGLDPFVSLLRHCPKFIELDDQNKLLVYNNTDRIPFVYNIGDKTIRFQKNVTLTVAAHVDDLIGMNAFCVWYDEAESGGSTEYVLNLYSEIKSRIKSRFGISKISYASIISSARRQNGVVQTYVDNLSPEDYKYIRVSAYRKWEVSTPVGFDPFANGKFWVLNGTSNFPSQLLSEEQAQFWLNNPTQQPSNTEIIPIPIVYLVDFKQNLEKALQDIAGVPTATSASPFPDLTRIIDRNLVRSLRLLTPVVSVNDGGTTLDLLAKLPPEIAVKSTINIKAEKRFYRYPSVLRYVHVDLAEVGYRVAHVLRKEFDK